MFSNFFLEFGHFSLLQVATTKALIGEGVKYVPVVFFHNFVSVIGPILAKLAPFFSVKSIFLRSSSILKLKKHIFDAFVNYEI